LAESLVGLMLLGVATLSCLTAVSFNQVSTAKSKEEAVALDFMLHYLETVRGMSFDELKPGAPVSSLFDGIDGAPNIRLPLSAAYMGVDTADYRAFHPELTWLDGRQPQFRVVLTEEAGANGPRTKHLHLDLKWQPPLGQGATSMVSMDVVRARDL
jgi:hypothetical protein